MSPNQQWYSSVVIDATTDKWKDVVSNMIGQSNEAAWTGLPASTHPDHKLELWWI